MQEKNQIRKHIINTRSHLTDRDVLDKSLSITKSVIKLLQYDEAELIYLYMDFRNEAMTSFIAKDAFEKGKRVAIPKIEAGIMNFYNISSLDEVEVGYFGVLEPIAAKTRKAVTDKGIVIVPGVAFSETGHRIGYGKGFYDRFFANNSQMIKVAICYECQIAEPFYNDIFDVKMDLIVTEDRIINCS